MDIELLKQSIRDLMAPLDPEIVILFGSYAYGAPREDSDIDLYIVSKEDFLPRTFSENMQHYKKFSLAFKCLKERYPFDIIIHTREMNRKFESSGSSFAREILTNGIRII